MGGDGHSHGDEEPGEVLANLSEWNLAVVTGIITAVFLIGLPTTIFNIYALLKKKKESNTVTILCSSILTLVIAYFSALPMTLYIIYNMGELQSNFCFVQESLTYIQITSGLFFPSLLAVCRYDYVLNSPQRKLTISKMIVIVILMILLCVILTIIPVFTINTELGYIHADGCHMWSGRHGDYLWYQIGAIASCLFISILIMIFTYHGIYKKAKIQTQAMKKYEKNGKSNAAFSDTLTRSTKKKEQKQSIKEEFPSIEFEMSFSGSDESFSKVKQRHRARMAMHKKVGIIASAIIASYIFFWLPWIIINVIITMDIKQDLSANSTNVEDDMVANIPAEVRILSMVIGYIPCATDSIMYALMSPNIIETFVEVKGIILSKLCKK